MKKTQKGSTNLLILIIIILLIIIVAGISYILGQNNENDNLNNKDVMENESNTTQKEEMINNSSVENNSETPAKSSATTNVSTGSSGTLANFNGAWSGTAIPKDLTSGCTGATLNINISNGKVSGSGKDPISGASGAITGTVTAEGSINAGIAIGGGLTINWGGNLVGNKGEGIWTASDGCKGSWSLSK